MRIKQIVSGFFVFCLTVISSSAFAADPSVMNVSDISSCMRVNVFDRGALRDFQIKAVDREGKSNSLKAKIFWRPNKTDKNVHLTLQVIEPKTLAGTAYLLTGNAEKEQLHLYLPAIRRVKTVVGSEMTQKLWGSDFTFSDIKQVQGLLLNGDIQRLDDAKVSGRPVYLLQTMTDIEKTGYRKVLSYVDQQSCVLLKSELFSEGEDPHKVLTADVATLMEIDPWWLILSYRMADHRAGTHTDLALSDIYIHERLPKSLFTPEGFYVNQR